MSRQMVGREHQRAPGLIDPRMRANIFLVLVAVWLLGCWHVAAAVTLPGVRLGEAGVTWEAAVRLRPVAGLPGGVEHQVQLFVTFGILIVLGLVLLTGLLVLRSRWRARRGGVGLANRHAVRDMLGEKRVRESAAQTRPGMTARQRKRCPVEQVALPLGREATSRTPVFLSLQDHLAILGGSGAGKSARVMIPAALTAPGALVVTSNEVSIIDIVAAPRSKMGTVWVFDPLGRSHWPEPMSWNPLEGCEDGETAISRGKAFVAGVGSDKDTSNGAFFKGTAADAVVAMMHAAALTGRTMSDVLDWAVSLDTEYQTPAELLRNSGDPRAEKRWASELESVSTGADATVASTRQTLQRAVKPLSLRKVAQWVTPRPGVPQFNVRDFVHSSDTLVLLSDDSASTDVGPLCTMLFQEVIDTVKVEAPLLDHRRLDPPMRVVGDEIANIAPIDKLPEMATEVRKHGIQLILAFQSETQPRARWGAERGQLLLENMAELALSGLKSVSSLERYSKLAGKADVDTYTTSFSANGYSHGGSAGEQERVRVREDEIRELGDGRGLLIWRNAKPVIVELPPWWERRDAKTLEQDAKEQLQRRQEQARSRGGAGHVHG